MILVYLALSSPGASFATLRVSSECSMRSNVGHELLITASRSMSGRCGNGLSPSLSPLPSWKNSFSRNGPRGIIAKMRATEGIDPARRNAVFVLGNRRKRGAEKKVCGRRSDSIKKASDALLSRRASACETERRYFVSDVT